MPLDIIYVTHLACLIVKPKTNICKFIVCMSLDDECFNLDNIVLDMPLSLVRCSTSVYRVSLSLPGVIHFVSWRFSSFISLEFHSGKSVGASPIVSVFFMMLPFAI